MHVCADLTPDWLHLQVYPEWTNPLNNLRNAVEKLRDKEQRADLKAMANMYGLALEAQRRIPGRCSLNTPHGQSVCTSTLLDFCHGRDGRPIAEWRRSALDRWAWHW